VFSSPDVLKLLGAVPARRRANTVLIADFPIIASVSQFESAAGARLYPEAAEGRVLGRRLLEVTGMDEIVNATLENYIAAAFDPRQYVIVDRLDRRFRPDGARSQPQADRRGRLVLPLAHGRRHDRHGRRTPSSTSPDRIDTMPNSKQQSPSPEPGLYEVLSRRADGHETVHRVRARSEAEARQLVADGGVPESDVVKASPLNVA
jgi:hypothetical protein